jgi:uncharacterized caspase-like protein
VKLLFDESRGAVMPSRLFSILTSSLLFFAIGTGAALAENRVALVIGNSAYQAVTPLDNPANDARAMGAFLTSAGFEVVSAPDLTQNDMRRVIGEFTANVARKGSDTVALVYYAGHGVQVDGDNYLVPVDANIRRESDVPLQAVRLVDLMNALASVPSKTRIVMLDACRNNPFSEINKTGGRGLAIVDAPTGSIVSYATAPGFEAEDGAGQNSPYTSALVTTAKEPGLPIEQAFKRVRYSVHQATEGRQTPWESSSLTGDFSFFPGALGAKPTTPAVSTKVAAAGGGPSMARSVESWRKELQGKPPRDAYEIVVREDTVEAYQAYLALYTAPPFTPRVRTLVDRRQIMVAWYIALTVNTPASYRAFLASYPTSDLAITARLRMERALNRAIATDVPPVQAACICPQPQQLQKQTKSQKRASRSKRGPGPGDEPIPASGPPPRATVDPVVPALIGIGVGIGTSIGRHPSGPSGPMPPQTPTGPSGSHPHPEPTPGTMVPQRRLY